MKQMSVFQRTKNLLFVKKGVNNLITFSIMVLLVFILTGCAIKRPVVNVEKGSVDEIALMSTTFNFILPGGISGPAAIARGQFRNRAEEINKIMSGFIDSLHNAVASNLKVQLGCKVFYGKDLHVLPQYKVVREKYELPDRLHKEDADFREVYISSEDFNFMIDQTRCGVLNGGTDVWIKPDLLKQTINNICRDLNIKYLALAQFNFTGFKTDIISPTNTYFNYYLRIYNQNGDFIAQSMNSEETSKVLGVNDINGSFMKFIQSYLEKSKSIEIRSTL